MPDLKPVGYWAFIFVEWLGRVERKAKLTRSCQEFGVPLDVIEVQAHLQFAIADWTKHDGIAVCLCSAVGTHHQALVVNAVTHAKHVADFMCSNFDDSDQEIALLLEERGILFVGPSWLKAMQALDASKRRDAITEAIVW